MARTRRLTAEEAAERLGLSISRVTELARNGDLGRKVAGRWMFSEAEVRRVMREREDRATAMTQRKRMERDHRRLHGLPPKRSKPRQRTRTTVLSRPVGTGDDAQSFLCRVWPDTGEVIMMTPNHWDAFVMALSQSHGCAGAARR